MVEDGYNEIEDGYNWVDVDYTWRSIQSRASASAFSWALNIIFPCGGGGFGTMEALAGIRGTNGHHHRVFALLFERQLAIMRIVRKWGNVASGLPDLVDSESEDGYDQIDESDSSSDDENFPDWFSTLLQQSRDRRQMHWLEPFDSFLLD